MNYINDINWLFILVVTFLGLLLSYLLKWNKKINLIIIFLDIVYALVLFNLLFTRVLIYGDTMVYQLIPFKSIIQYIMKNDLRIFEYIIITIPMPILFYLTFKNISRKKCLLYSCFIVFLFEPIQLLINIIFGKVYKIIDIDSTLLYIIGCLTGSIIIQIIIILGQKGLFKKILENKKIF